MLNNLDFKSGKHVVQLLEGPIKKRRAARETTASCWIRNYDLRFTRRIAAPQPLPKLHIKVCESRLPYNLHLTFRLYKLRWSKLFVELDIGLLTIPRSMPALAICLYSLVTRCQEKNHGDQKLLFVGAVVVAQLIEHMLLTPDIRGLNPNIGKSFIHPL